MNLAIDPFNIEELLVVPYVIVILRFAMLVLEFRLVGWSYHLV